MALLEHCRAVVSELHYNFISVSAAGHSFGITKEQVSWTLETSKITLVKGFSCLFSLILLATSRASSFSNRVREVLISPYCLNSYGQCVWQMC